MNENEYEVNLLNIYQSAIKKIFSQPGVENILSTNELFKLKIIETSMKINTKFETLEKKLQEFYPTMIDFMEKIQTIQKAKPKLESNELELAKEKIITLKGDFEVLFNAYKELHISKDPSNESLNAKYLKEATYTLNEAREIEEALAIKCEFYPNQYRIIPNELSRDTNIGYISYCFDRVESKLQEAIDKQITQDLENYNKSQKKPNQTITPA